MNQSKKPIRTIEFPPLSKLINDRFRELWNNKDRYLILYGSRGSSKSDFIALMIIYRMLNDKYFKGLAIRNTYEGIRESSYATILKIIDRYGLEPFFKVTSSPLKIVCNNGNQLIFKGLDDTAKIKGTNDPNFIWYEEDIVDTEENWQTISTTLRSSKAEYIQEVWTINPVIEDYETNWFYKMFFETEKELNFRKKFEFTNEESRTFTQYATIHHSTFKDNRWLDESALAKIELMAKGNAYLYQVYNLGVWSNRIIDGRFFRGFDITKHCSYKDYNPDKPLHISFDQNIRPYSAATIFQVYDKIIYQIDEICVLNKEITTAPMKQTCNRIKEKYPNHSEGIYIYGDPSGKKEDTRSDKGWNDYSIIENELKSFRPQLRVMSKAPAVKTSGEFVNAIFESNYSGLELFINHNCRETIKDLQYLKVDKEGGKLIEKIKDGDGAQMEKYGHTGDTLRYFIISYFSDEYNKYKNPGGQFQPQMGNNRFSQSW